ncbi:hypothetical protein MASR1M32_16530 [Rhodobacter sp.]
MSEPATFDESDWAALSGADKKALRILHNYGFNSISPDPLARAAGVGAKSMESLIRKGLATEAPSGLHGRYFLMTDKGTLATSWLLGHRIRVYPQG